MWVNCKVLVHIRGLTHHMIFYNSLFAINLQFNLSCRLLYWQEFVKIPEVLIVNEVLLNVVPDGGVSENATLTTIPVVFNEPEEYSNPVGMSTL